MSIHNRLIQKLSTPPMGEYLTMKYFLVRYIGAGNNKISIIMER